MQNDECKIVVSPSEMDFDFMSEGHTIILHFAFNKTSKALRLCSFVYYIGNCIAIACKK